MSETSYAKLPLKLVLEDLASRFIINLPVEEQTSLERICFQVEQAHWFYDDFIRPQNPSLPSYHLRTFCEALLKVSGIELDGSPATAYDRFLKYKHAVPVCGAIMLNPSMDKVVLVRGFKSSSSWTFPRGKINQNESERDCAVREVWEETGYDISPHFDEDLKPWPSGSKSGPPPLRDDIDLDDSFTVRAGESHLKLFVVPGVLESTPFATRTRREIGKIAWFPLNAFAGKSGPASTALSGTEDLRGTKFFMVTPAIKPLRAWIKRQRRPQRGNAVADRSTSVSPTLADASSPFTNVDEANKALNDFFFGPGRPDAEPDARTPLITILKSEPPPQPAAVVATPTTGLLDAAERERKEAELLTSLFAIGEPPKATSAPPTDMLDALFSNARHHAAQGQPRAIHPVNVHHDVAAASRPAQPTADPLFGLFAPQPNSHHLPPPGQPAYSHAPFRPIPLSGGYNTMPPPSMPTQAALPPHLLPQFGATIPGMNGSAWPPVSHPPPMGQPLPPPSSQPLPPSTQVGFLPSTPLTTTNISSAGPPLQPMPRRPITLLERPTPPPTGPTHHATTNSDALLSLLNAGARPPGLPTTGHSHL